MAVKIKTGIKAEQREDVAQGLTRLLGDSFSLYLKTHGFHWNVRGPNFSQLHLLFEGQYTEQWTALDQIAERIRALGEYAPQGYGVLSDLTSIKDGSPQTDADAMVEELMRGHETVIATARAVLKQAEKDGDPVTVDLATQRLTAHEKHAWMLRATLGVK